MLMPRRLDLDISNLRTFVAVAERSNMTAAASVLNLTQGAISQQIMRLETQLTASLFDRSGKGVRLTSAGERLRLHALRLLAHHDEICANFVGDQVAGQVRLGVPYDLAGGFISPILRRYVEKYPEAELSIICGTSPELLARIHRGELDIALAEAPITATGGERVHVGRLVWIGAEGGRAHTRDPIPVSLVSETCAFRPAMIEALSNHGVAWRSVFENGAVDATMATVSADLAITAWLEPIVPTGLEILESSTGLPELPAFSINLHLATPAAPPAVSALAQVVREQLRA